MLAMTHLVERAAVLRQRHSGSRCPHATGKGPTARQGFKAVSNGDNSSSNNNNNNTTANQVHGQQIRLTLLKALPHRAYKSW